MRNSIKLIFVYTLIFFSSCEKENLTEQTPEPQNVSIRGVKYITSSSTTAKKSVVNGMLEFDDIATFLTTISDLEQQAETYDDAFLQQWGYLNDDDLEAKEIALSYNSHQPFIDFENQFNGFTSLRKSIQAQQATLIKNHTLNDSNEPDNHFIMENEVRTVLNADAQVKIGTSLYQMTRFGYVEVKSGDFSTLALVASSDASKMAMLEVIVEGGYYGSTSGNNTQNGGGTTGCRTDIDETNYKSFSKNYRIKGIQKLKGYSAIWGTKIKSKTVYQKKRTWGGWTSQREWITAEIGGNSVDRYCAQLTPENEVDSHRRHEVIAKISAPSTYVYKTNYQDLKTIHKKNDNSNVIDDYFYE